MCPSNVAFLTTHISIPDDIEKSFPAECPFGPRHYPRPVSILTISNYALISVQQYLDL